MRTLLLAHSYKSLRRGCPKIRCETQHHPRLTPSTELALGRLRLELFTPLFGLLAALLALQHNVGLGSAFVGLLDFAQQASVVLVHELVANRQLLFDQVFALGRDGLVIIAADAARCKVKLGAVRGIGHDGSPPFAGLVLVRTAALTQQSGVYIPHLSSVLFLHENLSLFLEKNS